LPFKNNITLKVKVGLVNEAVVVLINLNFDWGLVFDVLWTHISILFDLVSEEVYGNLLGYGQIK
jgi:hypothetical protein